MTSDEALMLEFQAGSRAAFEELFARYHKALYGFFGRRLNNTARTEDLSQETFLAVIRAVSRYEPRASVRTEGKNGFVYIVERAWMDALDSPEFWNPKNRGPLCYNATAARTVPPITLMDKICVGWTIER
jgi:Sigma-70 region 2